MPFIGNQPALSYTSFAKQDFTTSATTSYTLDNPVTNENELALFINFVRQEPTTAYTASGTTLTLTSATSASDDMYCVFLGKAVQTVNPPNSSVGSSQVSADLITGQTALGATPADTDELLISDAGTLKRVDYSYLKSSNTPAFDARASSNQTGLTSGGWTKVQFDTELFDVGSGYDATNDKFVVPSGEAGKYFFTTSAKINSAGGSATLLGTGMRFTKNGSNIKQAIHFVANGSNTAEGKGVSCVLDLAVSDYIEVYAYYQDNGGGTGSITGSSDFDTYFTGFKLIG